MESDDPKFSCDACGTEFRWKPEIVGKKAKCKCGAVIEVPEHPTLVPLEEPAEDEADDDARGEYDVIEPPPKPVVPMQQTVPYDPNLPPTAVMTGTGVVDRKR